MQGRGNTLSFIKIKRIFKTEEKRLKKLDWIFGLKESKNRLNFSIKI
jgi:hypothetical protein